MGSSGQGIYGGGVTSKLRKKIMSIKDANDVNNVSLIEPKPGTPIPDNVRVEMLGGKNVSSDSVFTLLDDGTVQAVNKSGNVQLYVPTKYIGAEGANEVTDKLKDKLMDKISAGGTFKMGPVDKYGERTQIFEPFTDRELQSMVSKTDSTRQTTYLVPLDNPSGFELAKNRKGVTGWTVRTGRELASHPDAYIGDSYVGPGFAINRRSEIERIYQSASFQRDASKETKAAVAQWLKENPVMRRTKGQVEELISDQSIMSGKIKGFIRGKLPVPEGQDLKMQTYESGIRPKLGEANIRIVDPHLNVNIIGVDINRVKKVADGVYQVHVTGISQPIYTDRMIQYGETSIIRGSTNKLFLQYGDDIEIQRITSKTTKLTPTERTVLLKDKQARREFNKELVAAYESLSPRGQKALTSKSKLSSANIKEFADKYGMSKDDAMYMMLKAHKMSGNYAYEMALLSGASTDEALLARERVRRAFDWEKFKKTGVVSVEGTYRYDQIPDKPTMDPLRFSNGSASLLEPGSGYAGYQSGADDNSDINRAAAARGEAYSDLPDDNPKTVLEGQKEIAANRMNDWLDSLPTGATPSTSIERIALGIHDAAIPLQGEPSNLEKYLTKHSEAVKQLKPSKQTQVVVLEDNTPVTTDKKGNLVGLNKQQSDFVKREIAKSTAYVGSLGELVTNDSGTIQTKDNDKLNKPVFGVQVADGGGLEKAKKEREVQVGNFAYEGMKISAGKLKELQDVVITFNDIPQEKPDKGLGSRSTLNLMGPPGTESFVDKRVKIDGRNLEDQLIGDYNKDIGNLEVKVSPTRYRDYTATDFYHVDTDGNVVTIGKGVLDAKDLEEFKKFRNAEHRSIIKDNAVQTEVERWARRTATHIANAEEGATIARIKDTTKTAENQYADMLDVLKIDLKQLKQFSDRGVYVNPSMQNVLQKQIDGLEQQKYHGFTDEGRFVKAYLENKFKIHELQVQIKEGGNKAKLEKQIHTLEAVSKRLSKSINKKEADKLQGKVTKFFGMQDAAIKSNIKEKESKLHSVKAIVKSKGLNTYNKDNSYVKQMLQLERDLKDLKLEAFLRGL